MSYREPNLFICGAPRAGTTTLYRALRQHPDVCMSQRKETGVFLENYDKGLDWLADNYLSHYEGESVTGEATTGHMQHPPSARRMAETVPEARLAFILRDPVERVHSHYRFHRQSGQLGPEEDFSTLIRDESSEWRQIQLDNGRYHKHLTRFESHFDRSQMKVLLLDDLKSDAPAVANELYEFAGVDPSFEPDLSRAHNEGRMPKYEGLYRAVQACWQPVRDRLGIDVLDATQTVRDWVRDQLTNASARSEMRPADRKYLQALYRAPNRRLEKWLGTELSDWS
ncbi:sulfotransferase family protein [Salinibacter ruber]|uniref:sulfotransferase family protein n=1 Tax=Salinibacter ruber TaxID=146919 RepID=UPI0021693FD8